MGAALPQRHFEGCPGLRDVNVLGSIRLDMGNCVVGDVVDRHWIVIFIMRRGGPTQLRGRVTRLFDTGNVRRRSLSSSAFGQHKQRQNDSSSHPASPLGNRDTGKFPVIVSSPSGTIASDADVLASHNPAVNIKHRKSANEGWFHLRVVLRRRRTAKAGVAALTPAPLSQGSGAVG